MVKNPQRYRARVVELFGDEHFTSDEEDLPSDAPTEKINRIVVEQLSQFQTKDQKKKEAQYKRQQEALITKRTTIPDNHLSNVVNTVSKMDHTTTPRPEDILINEDELVETADETLKMDLMQQWAIIENQKKSTVKSGSLINHDIIPPPAVSRSSITTNPTRLSFTDMTPSKGENPIQSTPKEAVKEKHRTSNPDSKRSIRRQRFRAIRKL